ETVVDLDDPYRFPPVLSDFDLYLLGEGTHQRIYDKLGAHPMTLDGVSGGSVSSAISISGTRGDTRCGSAALVIGSCSCPTPRRAIVINSISSARRVSTCRRSEE